MRLSQRNITKTIGLIVETMIPIPRLCQTFCAVPAVIALQMALVKKKLGLCMACERIKEWPQVDMGVYL